MSSSLDTVSRKSSIKAHVGLPKAGAGRRPDLHFWPAGCGVAPRYAGHPLPWEGWGRVASVRHITCPSRCGPRLGRVDVQGKGDCRCRTSL